MLCGTTLWRSGRTDLAALGLLTAAYFLLAYWLLVRRLNRPD
jgi:hypothetical protein